jgi:sarcosine oxidase subunit alpha
MTGEVQLRVDGRKITVPAGTVVAAAIALAGVSRFRCSIAGQPRGPLCGMGICMECLATINGRPLARTCLTLCEPDMEVATDSATPRTPS